MIMIFEIISRKNWIILSCDKSFSSGLFIYISMDYSERNSVEKFFCCKHPWQLKKKCSKLNIGKRRFCKTPCNHINGNHKTNRLFPINALWHFFLSCKGSQKIFSRHINPFPHKKKPTASSGLLKFIILSS